MQKISMVIADDHPSARLGLRQILAEADDIAVVGEATDGWEARRLVAQLRPDVLLLDFRMPGPRASETEAWVREHYPDTITLVITAHNRDAYLAEMMATETRGFLTKGETPQRLRAAVRRAAQGESLFNQEQYTRLRHWQREVGEKWESLSEREREVLYYVMQGEENACIAETLQVSVRTVEYHVSNLLGKLQLESRLKIALWAREHLQEVLDSFEDEESREE